MDELNSTTALADLQQRIAIVVFRIPAQSADRCLIWAVHWDSLSCMWFAWRINGFFGRVRWRSDGDWNLEVRVNQYIGRWHLLVSYISLLLLLHFNKWLFKWGYFLFRLITLHHTILDIFIAKHERAWILLDHDDLLAKSISEVWHEFLLRLLKWGVLRHFVLRRYR